MTKVVVSGIQASKVSNGASKTSKSFTIQNVELDVYMNKTSQEIADKYGKTPEDVFKLIQTGYCRNASKERELRKRLETTDDEARKRAMKRFNAEEKERLAKQSVAETIIPKPVKSAISCQRDRVDAAQKNLDAARAVVSSLEEELKQARKQQKNAIDALKKAEKAKEDADDSVRRIESRKVAAEKAREECREAFQAEDAKLQELCSQPKLLHSSAFKTQRGHIEGRVFVSQWDYDNLLDDSMKGLVSPVGTDGMELKNYPAGFHRYPAMMGMEAYTSAVECALAYMKLQETEGNEVELICSNEVVKALVELQEVSA